MASAPGSVWVRSSDELLGMRKVIWGMLNSHATVLLHLDVCCFTITCVSGLYSWMANSVGYTGCGGGGTPPFRRISSCESEGCVQPGFASTSP